MEGNDGDGTDSIFALDCATGAELWKFSYPCKTAAHEMPMVPSGPGATPVIHDDHLYALSREGELHCLDVVTGSLVWKKSLLSDLGGKRPVYGYAQTPLIVGNRIFLDVGSAAGAEGSTVALDAATGDVMWKAGTGEAGYSSARLLERDGKSYVAMFKGEAMVLFDPADGKVLWSFKTTARDFCNALTPVFVGHKVLASNTGDPFARLLDWDLGAEPNVHPVWQNQQFSILFNNPILLDGCLFAFNEKRRGHVEFTCLDAETGVSRWVSDAVPVGTFILSDGHWLFLTREGEIVLAPATAAELKPIAKVKILKEKCYATPALANGRLFVRSNTGEVAAVDLRPASAALQTAR